MYRALLHMGYSQPQLQERMRVAGGQVCVERSMTRPGSTPLTKREGRTILEWLALLETRSRCSGTPPLSHSL